MTPMQCSGGVFLETDKVNPLMATAPPPPFPTMACINERVCPMDAVPWIQAATEQFCPVGVGSQRHRGCAGAVGSVLDWARGFYAEWYPCKRPRSSVSRQIIALSQWSVVLKL